MTNELMATPACIKAALSQTLPGTTKLLSYIRRLLLLISATPLKVEMMSSKLMMVSLGLVFVAGIMVLATPATTVDKRAQVDVNFDSANISYPPSREDIDATLKEAVFALNGAIKKVEDPNYRLNVDVPSKRDADLVTLTDNSADQPSAKDEPSRRVKRRRGRGRVNIRINVRTGKR